MNPETVSYMMLICAILLAKNKGVVLGDSLKLVPLTGGARTLADELSVTPSR